MAALKFTCDVTEWHGDPPIQNELVSFEIMKNGVVISVGKEKSKANLKVVAEIAIKDAVELANLILMKYKNT